MEDHGKESLTDEEIELMQDYAEQMLKKLQDWERGPPPRTFDEGKKQNSQEQPGRQEVDNHQKKANFPRQDKTLNQDQDHGIRVNQPPYSRTCPVRIRYKGNPKDIIGLALLDDHNSRTSVDERITEDLEIDPSELSAVSFSLTTMEKKDSIHHTYEIEGLSIECLDAPGNRIWLPKCSLHPEGHLDAIREIPSPETVSKIPTLQHLSGKFPRIDPNWRTLLLVGRDCKKAMSFTRFIEGNESTPHAMETPLGWSLIGSLSLPHQMLEAGMHQERLQETKQKMLEQLKEEPRKRHQLQKQEEMAYR
jgi:hypothetical protein